MLTPAEWEQRKTQVGASDVPKLFNFDNKGAKDLWREKVGLLDKAMFENKYTVAGNIIEEPSLLHAFQQLGIKRYSMNDRIEHTDIKGFMVSLDGLDLENYVPIENKSIKHSTWVQNSARFNEKGIEDVTYYRQLQAQISALNASGGWLVYNVLQDVDYVHPVLYEPSEEKQERRYHKRDGKMIKEIEKRVSYFLECMKEKKEPKETDYKRYARGVK